MKNRNLSETKYEITMCLYSFAASHYITLNLEWKMPKHLSHFADALKFSQNKPRKGRQEQMKFLV